MKPKRREASYTVKEIAKAWEAAGCLYPLHGSHFLNKLRRIARQRKKGKVGKC